LAKHISETERASAGRVLV